MRVAWKGGWGRPWPTVGKQARSPSGPARTLSGEAIHSDTKRLPGGFMRSRSQSPGSSSGERRKHWDDARSRRIGRNLEGQEEESDSPG